MNLFAVCWQWNETRKIWAKEHLKLKDELVSSLAAYCTLNRSNRQQMIALKCNYEATGGSDHRRNCVCISFKLKF